MELNEMIADLSGLGCRPEQKEAARKLYESRNMTKLIRYLKKHRCVLLDEMHESQRRVDRIDMIISRAEKEAKKER
ncbi:MAG: hypothetical protein K5697_08420 [Lachnospiraceae bacterium]|nr:hypothetical protein [Lachnospiraceae bacterium]